MIEPLIIPREVFLLPLASLRSIAFQHFGSGPWITRRHKQWVLQWWCCYCLSWSPWLPQSRPSRACCSPWISASTEHAGSMHFAIMIARQRCRRPPCRWRPCPRGVRIWIRWSPGGSWCWTCCRRLLEYGFYSDSRTHSESSSSLLLLIRPNSLDGSS